MCVYERERERERMDYKLLSLLRKDKRKRGGEGLEAAIERRERFD